MDGLDAVDLNDKDNSSRHSRVGTGLGVGNSSLELGKELWRETTRKKANFLRKCPSLNHFC
jgi:hypothetical protein